MGHVLDDTEAQRPLRSQRVVIEKATGKRRIVWAVDARELIAPQADGSESLYMLGPGQGRLGIGDHRNADTPEGHIPSLDAAKRAAKREEEDDGEGEKETETDKKIVDPGTSTGGAGMPPPPPPKKATAKKATAKKAQK